MAWEKGQSGNPGGRPKAFREITDAARTASPEAIETLIRWMRSDKPQASIAACNALLDRGFGKAPQYIEHGGAVGFFDALAMALANGAHGADGAERVNVSGTEAGAPESSSGSIQ